MHEIRMLYAICVFFRVCTVVYTYCQKDVLRHWQFGKNDETAAACSNRSFEFTNFAINLLVTMPS